MTPEQKTHKQKFATHPIPGQSLKFVYVYVFSSPDESAEDKVWFGLATVRACGQAFKNCHPQSYGGFPVLLHKSLYLNHFSLYLSISISIFISEYLSIYLSPSLPIWSTLTGYLIFTSFGFAVIAHKTSSSWLSILFLSMALPLHLSMCLWACVILNVSPNPHPLISYVMFPFLPFSFPAPWLWLFFCALVGFSGSPSSLLSALCLHIPFVGLGFHILFQWTPIGPMSSLNVCQPLSPSPSLSLSLCRSVCLSFCLFCLSVLFCSVCFSPFLSLSLSLRSVTCTFVLFVFSWSLWLGNSAWSLCPLKNSTSPTNLEN